MGPKSPLFRNAELKERSKSMTAMSQERLNSILSQFSRLKVAVIGDFFLDKYQIIDPSLDEPSIETGLTARQVVEVRNVPGAAGTVTNNLVSLGVGQIDAIGFVGEDGEGHDLFNGLRSRGVNCDSMLVARDRFTPTYTKPMIRVGSEETELNRIDIKNRTPTSKEIESELTDILWEHLHPSVEKSVVNAVIVLDQVSEANCGVVTEHIRAVISDMAIKQPHVIFFVNGFTRIEDSHTFIFIYHVLKCFLKG